MSSSIIFSSKTRDAGDLDSESALFRSDSFRMSSVRLGSMRSSAKPPKTDSVDSSARHKSNKTDNMDNIQPLKDVPPPAPPKSSDKKRASKKLKDDTNKPEKKRSSARDRDSAQAGAMGENYQESEEEFMESMRRITNRHQRRRQNKENTADRAELTSTKSFDRTRADQLNSSFRSANSAAAAQTTRETSTIDRSQRDAEANTFQTRPRSNSLVVKHAFLPAKSDAGESGDDNEVEVAVERKSPKSTDNPAAPQPNEIPNVQSDYFSSIYKSSMVDFLLTPAPVGKTICCKIVCQKGFFNEYSFYLENFNTKDLLIMKAHRRITSTKSYYLINLVNYNSYGIQTSYNQHDSNLNCARIVSNIYRRKFRLDLNNNYAVYNNRDLLNVTFKTTVGEPTKIMASAGLCSPSSEAKDKVTYFLKNRSPYYDTHRKKYVLDYFGRARKSSKHNFQIVDESQPNDTIILVGKMDNGVYSCDFTFPLCALQAFAFALSSLCR